MHGEFCFAIIILKVSVVFLESYAKGTASLSNIFHVTVRHVSLRTPLFSNCLCAFVWVGFRLRILLMVLLVVCEILTGEFLNSLVINLVSFPVYVNFAHVCHSYPVFLYFWIY